MITVRLVVFLAVIATVAVVSVFSEECDKNGKGGCNTYVKTSAGVKVNSETMKHQRQSYQANKKKGLATGVAGTGARQVASKSSDGKLLAQSSGGKKNGKAGLSKSKTAKKPTYVGGAGNSRIGYAGKKGDGQVQNLYAKRKGGNSYSGLSRLSTSGNVDTVQSYIADKKKPKDQKKFAVKKSDNGQAYAKSNKSPITARISGIKKGTKAVEGTSHTGNKPPALDKKKFNAKVEEKNNQKLSEYVGPTDLKYLKGRNSLAAQEQKSGNKDKVEIKGANALLGSFLGNKAAVGIGAESDSSKNTVETSSSIFGTSVSTGTTAKVNSYKEVQCSGDFKNYDAKDPDGFKFQKINSVKLKQEADGSYKFPSCMDVNAKARIAAGVDLRDVAVSMSLTIPGCGQYKCGSSHKCGPLECFYRRLCPDSTQKGSSKFSDAGDYLLSGMSQSDACEIPVSNRARDVDIKFKYCPDQDATTKQSGVCNKSLFSLFTKLSGDSKSSMTIQLDMYVATDPFSCSDLTKNFKKVACKQYRYDYTVSASGALPAKGSISGGTSSVDCKSASNKNHPQCQGV